MALKKKEHKNIYLLFLATVIIQVGVTSAENFDCKGKAFYCLNSTHFMICVDFGDGISKSVDDFLIPCPPPTTCLETNIYECEFHTPTTLNPIIQQSEVTKNVIETSPHSFWEGTEYTTATPPFWYINVGEKSEQYNTGSSTVENELFLNNDKILPHFKSNSDIEATTKQIEKWETEYITTNELNTDSEILKVSTFTNQPQVDSVSDHYAEFTKYTVFENNEMLETTTELNLKPTRGQEVTNDFSSYTSNIDEFNIYLTTTPYYEQYFDTVSATTSSGQPLVEVTSRSYKSPVITESSHDYSTPEVYKSTETIIDPTYLVTDSDAKFTSNDYVKYFNSPTTDEIIPSTWSNINKVETSLVYTEGGVISDDIEQIRNEMKIPIYTVKYLQTNADKGFTENNNLETQTINVYDSKTTSIYDNIMSDVPIHTDDNIFSETTELPDNNLIKVTDLNHKISEITQTYTPTESTSLASNLIEDKATLYELNSLGITDLDFNQHPEKDVLITESVNIFETNTESLLSHNGYTSNMQKNYDSEKYSQTNHLLDNIHSRLDKDNVLKYTRDSATGIYKEMTEGDEAANFFPEGTVLTNNPSYEEMTIPNNDISSTNILLKLVPNAGAVKTTEVYVNEYPQENITVSEKMYEENSLSTLDSLASGPFGHENVFTTEFNGVLLPSSDQEEIIQRYITITDNFKKHDTVPTDTVINAKVTDSHLKANSVSDIFDISTLTQELDRRNNMNGINSTTLSNNFNDETKYKDIIDKIIGSKLKPIELNSNITLTNDVTETDQAFPDIVLTSKNIQATPVKYKSSKSVQNEFRKSLNPTTYETTDSNTVQSPVIIDTSDAAIEVLGNIDESKSLIQKEQPMSTLYIESQIVPTIPYSGNLNSRERAIENNIENNIQISTEYWSEGMTGTEDKEYTTNTLGTENKLYILDDKKTTYNNAQDLIYKSDTTHENIHSLDNINPSKLSSDTHDVTLVSTLFSETPTVLTAIPNDGSSNNIQYNIKKSDTTNKDLLNNINKSKFSNRDVQTMLTLHFDNQTMSTIPYPEISTEINTDHNFLPSRGSWNDGKSGTVTDTEYATNTIVPESYRYNLNINNLQYKETDEYVFQTNAPKSDNIKILESLSSTRGLNNQIYTFPSDGYLSTEPLQINLTNNKDSYGDETLPIITERYPAVTSTESNVYKSVETSAVPDLYQQYNEDVVSASPKQIHVNKAYVANGGTSKAQAINYNHEDTSVPGTDKKHLKFQDNLLTTINLQYETPDFKNQRISVETFSSIYSENIEGTLTKTTSLPQIKDNLYATEKPDILNGNDGISSTKSQMVRSGKDNGNTLFSSIHVTQGLEIINNIIRTGENNVNMLEPEVIFPVVSDNGTTSSINSSINVLLPKVSKLEETKTTSNQRISFVTSPIIYSANTTGTLPKTTSPPQIQATSYTTSKLDTLNLKDGSSSVTRQTASTASDNENILFSAIHVTTTPDLENIKYTIITGKNKINTPEPEVIFPIVSDKGTAENNNSSVNVLRPRILNEEKYHTSNSTKSEVNSTEKNQAKNQTTVSPVTAIHEATVNTRVIGFNCLNRFRGKYADENDCQKFYICIGRFYPIVGHCPINTVFSEILKQCTRNLSHCVRNNQFKCVRAGRFSDIWENNAYYICVKSKNKYVRFKLRCQKGYVLNIKSVTCIEDTSQVLLSKHEVDSKSSSSRSTDTRSENSENKPLKYNFKCTQEGIFSEPHDCRTYYLCTKNSKSEFRRRKKKCDSDEVFHKTKKKCVDAESYECDDF